MKSKIFLLFIVACAGATGWFAGHHLPERPSPSSPTVGRRIKFYQSSMHPWITSDKPGKCTVCGMDLVPVYEGDPGFAPGTDLVTLSSNSINVIHVQTEEVKRRPLERTLRVAGVIDDDDTRHRRLSAYVDGRIEKLFVNYIGAEVTEGQPLASVYSPMLLAAEREYVTLLRSDHSKMSTAAVAEHGRLLDAAAQRLLRLGLLRAQIAALAQKSENDSTTEILAPMSGTVVAREVYAGQYVKEGDRLFELADFSTMWFVFDAYERDLAWIQSGQAVEVTMPARPGAVYSAAITFIDPNLNEATRSAKVRVEILNRLIEENGVRRRELFHKLYAQGVVKLQLPETLAVPRSAVLSPGAQPVVYVDKTGGAYEQRRVSLGRAGDSFWEVLDGLAAGERVVTTGNLLIDAQAQLNRSALPPSEHNMPTVATNSASAARDKPTSQALSEALTDRQLDALKEFFSGADALASALAQDNLASFNQHAASLGSALAALTNAFSSFPAWNKFVQPFASSGRVPPANNLAGARKTFLPFSSEVVAFVQELRAARKEFAALKIYRCPMTNRAFPGAPKTGAWMQAEGPLRNPFFGAEMLDCGSEVQP